MKLDLTVFPMKGAMIMGIYFNDYGNFISIQPVGSVSRVEKSRKEQDERNKKQKIYKAKLKQVTPATTNTKMDRTTENHP